MGLHGCKPLVHVGRAVCGPVCAWDQFQSAGSVAPFLMRDFGIDYTQVGLLVGGFILPGIAISLPSGFLGRRFGDKSVVTAGMALMVLGGAIASFAPSYSIIL